MSKDKESYLTLRIPPDLKRMLKVRAAERGKLMSAVIVELITAWLRDNVREDSNG